MRDTTVTVDVDAELTKDAKTVLEALESIDRETVEAIQTLIETINGLDDDKYNEEWLDRHTFPNNIDDSSDNLDDLYDALTMNMFGHDSDFTLTGTYEGNDEDD